MSLPDVVSLQQWVTARKQLLAQEKELTRARDAVSAARRRLPMVQVTKGYRFEGPDGEVGLLDLFDGRTQLIVGHFMFDPEWEEGCSSCTAGADEMSSGHLEHLHVRDTTLAYVSRAPLAQRRGVGIEFVGEFPGRSSFPRVGDDVFHTYSVYARGAESIGGSYYLLDETALGRQEDWEEPQGRAKSARAAQPNFAP